VTVGQRFARFATNVVSRLPWLWVLFRRPLARMFDRMAPTWDGRRVTSQHLAPLEAALELVGGAPQRILDLGTGTGGAARVLAARWPEAGVTGVDLSPEMIREAQARATSERERYVAADASSLPFADGAFDLVVLLNMIPFYDELARVTAPGGSVVLAFSRGAQTPIWVPFDRSRAELRRRGFGSFEEAAAGSGKSLLAIRDEVS
jgi:ubiquinone/menaquinone biosynthesis C-methylase UbiE